MLLLIRRTLLELFAAICDSERHQQHYSRAMGWTIAALLVGGIVLGLVATSGDLPRQPACRAAAQGKSITVEPLALELARVPADLLRLLGSGSVVPPGLDPAVCLEERVARYRDILALDSALFIPLYALLGTMVLGWLLTVHLRADRAALQSMPKPGCIFTLALALMAGILLTAILDAEENRAAQHVLDLAVGQGALLDNAPTNLLAAIDAMRSASLRKWLAASVWMATFVGMAWWLRPAVASAKGEHEGEPWPRLLSNLLVFIGLFASLALLAGALLGWVGPVSAGGWARALLRAGFALFFVFPFLVVVLQVSHVRSTRMERANGEAKKLQCN